MISTISTTSTTATFKPSSAGTYYIWAKDAAGNVSEAATLTVAKKGITIPTAVAGLTYNGASQTGVSATTGCTVTKTILNQENLPF